MNDLSLYFLDIINNSISAQAKNIFLIINEQVEITQITITDDGVGMTNTEINQVLDPFYTKRQTRKFGFGLAFYSEMIRQCDGQITIESKINVGTSIIANIKTTHIDKPPIGDMGETIYSLLLQGVDVIYQHKHLDEEYIFDSNEVKNILGIVSITEYSVMVWIKENINNGLRKMVEVKR